MKTLLLVGRIAVVLGAMGLLSGSVFAGPEEIEQALSRAVRIPSPASLSEAREEVVRSLPEIFTRTIVDGTVFHDVLKEDKQSPKFFNLMSRAPITVLFVGHGRDESLSAYAAAARMGLVVDNFDVQSIQRSDTPLEAWNYLDVQLQFGKQKKDRSFKVRVTLSLPGAVATCCMTLRNTFLSGESFDGIASVVEAYPTILVQHRFEVHPSKNAIFAAEECKRLRVQNADLSARVKDLERCLESAESRVKASEQNHSQGAARVLNLLGELREVGSLDMAKVGILMGFFLNTSRVKDAASECRAHDTAEVQLRQFLAFAQAKHDLDRQVGVLEGRIQRLESLVRGHMAQLQTALDETISMAAS